MNCPLETSDPLAPLDLLRALHESERDPVQLLLPRVPARVPSGEVADMDVLKETLAKCFAKVDALDRVLGVVRPILDRIVLSSPWPTPTNLIGIHGFAGLGWGVLTTCGGVTLSRCHPTE